MVCFASPDRLADADAPWSKDREMTWRGNPSAAPAIAHPTRRDLIGESSVYSHLPLAPSQTVCDCCVGGAFEALEGSVVAAGQPAYSTCVCDGTCSACLVRMLILAEDLAGGQVSNTSQPIPQPIPIPLTEAAFLGGEIDNPLLPAEARSKAALAWQQTRDKIAKLNAMSSVDKAASKTAASIGRCLVKMNLYNAARLVAKAGLDLNAYATGTDGRPPLVFLTTALRRAILDPKSAATDRPAAAASLPTEAKDLARQILERFDACRPWRFDVAEFAREQVGNWRHLKAALSQIDRLERLSDAARGELATLPTPRRGRLQPLPRFFVADRPPPTPLIPSRSSSPAPAWNCWRSRAIRNCLPGT